MARFDIRTLTPPADSIWRCPCGFEGRYHQVLGHRRGYRGRPECDGKIRPLDSKLLYANIAHEAGSASDTGGGQEPVEDFVDESASGGLDESASGGEDAEADPGEETPAEDPDPEELARSLNSLNDPMNRGLKPVLERELLGMAYGPLDGHLPQGDWELETPAGEPQVSQAREVVALPVVVRVMYDWARSQGWHQGDGSLGAFVADIILDHWDNCWGKRIVVVDREEVEHGGERGAVQPGLEGKSPSSRAAAVK